MRVMENYEPTSSSGHGNYVRASSYLLCASMRDLAEFPCVLQRLPFNGPRCLRVSQYMSTQENYLRAT